MQARDHILPVIKGRTELIGVRFTPADAFVIRAEAKRRGISLADLFNQMWDHYRRPPQNRDAISDP